MNEEKKTEEKTTAEGAVEVKEEDLDQASGGAGYIKKPTDVQYDLKEESTPLDPTIQDTSLNFSQDTLTKKI
jgi:hypothetical protein